VLLFPVAKFRQKAKLRIKISPQKVIFEAFQSPEVARRRKRPKLRFHCIAKHIEG